MNKEYRELKGYTVKLEVGYELGGLNYASGGTNARGYYLYARIVEIKDEGGYKTESFSLFDGSSAKKLLVAVARKSKKAELTAVARAELYKDELANYVVASKFKKEVA